jgi:hypothetical protein
MHLPVAEYVKPEKFEWFNEQARKRKFLYVAGGPFVRSSYKAGELFMRGVLEKGALKPTQIKNSNKEGIGNTNSGEFSNNNQKI